MEDSESSTGKTGLWQRIFDLFFGYDYFIAHRSKDGKPYAAALYDALTTKGNEFDCFLDVRHYHAGGKLFWMQSRALKKTSRLIVISTAHAHDPDADHLRGEIEEFRRYHPNGFIVSIGSHHTLSRQSFAESTLLPMIPNLDQGDICILEEESDLSDGKVSPDTVKKLLIDFSEQRNSAKRLKWIQGIAVVMFLLALAAAGFWWRATIAQHAAELATENEKKARNAAEEQARIAESRRLAAEASLVLSKYPQRGLLLAVEAVKVGQSGPGRRVSATEQLLRELLDSVVGRPIAHMAMPIKALAISANKHWLITSGDDIVSLWDLNATNTGSKPVTLSGHEMMVNTVVISSDDHWLVTGSDDKTARLWDLRAKDPAANPMVLRGHDGPVGAVAISADERWVVTGSWDNTARLWDLNVKDPAVNPAILRGHEGAITAIAISPDSHWLVTGSDDETARLWDLSSKNPAANPAVLRGHESSIEVVAMSSDNRWVVTGSRDKTARLWDLTRLTGNCLFLHLKDEGMIPAMAVSPENHWIVTASNSNDIARLWNLRAKDPTADPMILCGHQGVIDAVAFSSNSRWLITTSTDKTARLWDLSAKDPAVDPAVLRGHEGAISAVAISPDSRWIVTAGWDKSVRIWDLRNKDPSGVPMVLRGHQNSVMLVAFTPDNRRVVSCSHDVRLWPLEVSDLIDLARVTVGRIFFANEWRLYFPGEKYRKTFPDLPGPD
jgi:WD40 repeat protein